jgi:hypothetical protein
MFLGKDIAELQAKVIIISRELDPFQGNGSFYFVLREIQKTIYEKSHFSLEK